MKQRFMIFRFSFCLLMGLCFTGCHTGTTQSWDKPLNLFFEQPPLSIAALEPALQSIVDAYAEQSLFVYAKAIFNGQEDIQSQTGRLTYTFYQSNGDNLFTFITITYDMREQKAIHMDFKQQTKQADPAMTQPVFKGKQALFSSIFEQLQYSNNQQFLRKLDHPKAELIIEFTSQGMNMDIK